MYQASRATGSLTAANTIVLMWTCAEIAMFSLMPCIPNRHRLPLVPASFFSIVLGLAGVANDWRAAHIAWSLPKALVEVLNLLAVSAWLIIAVLYALKWIVATEIAKQEAGHAVQSCFIGLSGVSTLLVAQCVLPYDRPVAEALFLLGAIVTIAFGVWLTGELWHGGRDPGTTTPVLYLPIAAGNFVLGTVSSALGWPEWGELAFGAGFFTWLAIESVVLHRLYTGPALPPALRPTLGIQLAPPAVGVTSYLSVNGGHPDVLAHMMIGYGVLQALLLARMGRWVAEQPFTPTYWAFTFGATALAGATTRVAIADHDGALAVLAPILFVLANLLVFVIAVGTIWLLIRHRLLPGAPPVAPGAV
jgi:tellurite resistance protein